LSAVPHFSTLLVVLPAIVVAISIPVGDLIESAIKRDLKVKDASQLIPGHGGVMDRFDSWIFVSPIMYYFLVIRMYFVAR
jgi:phosphatidate cytidylyltransferase